VELRYTAVWDSLPLKLESSAPLFWQELAALSFFVVPAVAFGPIGAGILH